MSATTLFCLLSVLAAGVAADDGTNEGETRRSIELKADASTLPLGTAIQLRAAYVNRATSAWKLAQPESSSAVIVKYRVAGEGNPVRMAFSLAKKSAQKSKRPDGSTQIVQTIPPPIDIEIQPGARHELAIDLSRGWTEELAPGDYEAWIEDARHHCESRKVRFTLVFSKESVAPLVATAAREEESPGKRKWCASWLRKIKPDFELQLEAAGASPEALKKARDFNAAAIQAFRERWQRLEASGQADTLFRPAAPKPKEPDR